MSDIKEGRFIKLAISITISFLCISSLKSQNTKQVYYSWKPDSVSVYQERNLEGLVLKKLPYGKRVTILKFFDEEVISSIPISQNKTYEELPKTKWVQIKMENGDGFLLLDQLSMLPIMKNSQKKYEEISSYFRRNFILKDSVLISKQYAIPASNEIYSIDTDSLSFKNGAYTLDSYFEGCTERNYFVPKLSFSNAYNMLAVTSFHILDSSDGNISTELELVKIENEKYKFEDFFGFTEFYIEISNDQSINFGWSSCD